MKNSIKFILTVAVVLTATIFTFAQRGGDKDHDPEKRAEYLTDRMVKSLELNEKQAAKVKEIHLAYAQKMKDAHVASKGKDKEAMKAVRDELNKGKATELTNVLTKEQLKSYQTKKAEMKGQRKGGEKGNRTHNPEERAERNTSRMVENLSLNDIQAAEIKAINLAYAQKHQEARKANKGTEREEMKAVRDKLEAEMETEYARVLTPEQLKNFQDQKDKMKNRKKGNSSGSKIKKSEK